MLTLVVFAGYKAAESPRAESFDGFALVDKAGNIQKPIDYRDHYQVLGTYAVLDPKGNQMHFTYGSPGAAEYYRKNGKFADGTVMVKDEKGRYPDNPLWGDGWGWALFKSDAPDKQVATDHKKDCLGCHIPARTTDWVYVQGYPVLAAK